MSSVLIGGRRVKIAQVKDEIFDVKFLKIGIVIVARSKSLSSLPTVL
jgi:phosphotransferase system IIA component